MSRIKLSIVKRLLKAYKEGHTMASACKFAGIAIGTHWNWCKRWPRLESKIEEMKQSRIPMLIDSLYSQGMKGDVVAAKSYLLNRGAWKMGDPKSLVPAVQVHNNVVQNNSTTLPKDDPERLRKNADLIRTFRLVDQYGSAPGQEAVSELRPEGQQGTEGGAGGDP